MTPSPAEKATRGGRFWACVPVALLVASVTGVGTLSSIAVHDPGFALEQNYYQRAVRWDAQQAEWAKNAALGYHVAVDVSEATTGALLVARVTDREGHALRAASVRAEGFANARSADRRALNLAERADGTYAVALGRARPGLWEFRFTVEDAGERFTAVERADIPAGGYP